MTSIIKVPMIAQSFYKTTEIPSLNNKLDTIEANFGSIITKVAAWTAVPRELITAFIFIESAGKPNAISKAGAIGLMQVKTATAHSMIWFEHSKKRLSTTELNALRATLGTRLDCILGDKHMNHKRPCSKNTGIIVTRTDLLNPAFNILVGAIYLGILIDQETQNKLIRLDRIVYRYNKGYFSKPTKGATIENLVANTNKETASYILKLAGKNGIMDIQA